MKSEQHAVLLAVRVSKSFRNEVKIVAARCDTTMEAFVADAVQKAIREKTRAHRGARNGGVNEAVT
jgi:hypothetical protein